MTETGEKTTQLRSSIGKQIIKLSLDDIKPFIGNKKALFLSPDLEIINVAIAFVQNQSSEVQSWIGESKLSPPSEELGQEWEEQDDEQTKTAFQGIIIQPYLIFSERERVEGEEEDESDDE